MNEKESKEFMDRLCEEILSVQPMPPNLFSDLLAVAEDEKTLIEEGYVPVSCHRVLWIKKEDQDEQAEEL